MKKNKLLLVVLAVVALAVICLAGCKPEGPEETQPPVMDAYWNVHGAQYNDNGVSTREPEADGTYKVVTAYKNRTMTLKVKADKELINKIDSLRIFGVVKDEKGYVTAVKTVEEMGGKIVYDGYAFEVGDNFEMNINTQADLKGESINIKTPSAGCYIFDLVSDPELPTRIFPTALIRGDKIVAVQDYSGAITNIYFYESGPIRSGKDQYCPHCCEEGEIVHFSAWSEDENPAINGGHYFLYEDKELADQFGGRKNTEIVIDLNGFKIFCENQTKRIIATYIKDCPEGEGCYIGFMDSSEAKTGTILNDHKQEQNSNGAAMWVTSYGTVEMFGGTIDASKCVSNGNGPAVQVGGGCTFIMHEGATILGGTTEAAEKEGGGRTSGGNGGAIYNGGTFIMYGGKIVGGTCLGYETDRGRGGAVYNGGTFEMHGGEIVGGYCDEEAVDKDGNPIDVSIIYNQGKAKFEQLGGTLTPAPAKEETPAPEGGTETAPETSETPEA